MASQLSNKIEAIELIARQDAEYCRLLERCVAEEDAWLEVMEALPAEQAETICQFLSACMDLVDRKINVVLDSIEI